MNTVCKECGSNSLEEDVQTGQLVCFDCESVNAQAEYDGGLAFSEGAAGNAQLVGQMLRAVTGSPQAVVKSRTGLRVFEGGKFSQVNAFRTATDLAQQLSLPNFVLAATKSLIRPALELNLRRGCDRALCCCAQSRLSTLFARLCGCSASVALQTRTEFANRCCTHGSVRASIRRPFGGQQLHGNQTRISPQMQKPY